MAETVVSGQSDTIIRMGQTLERNNLYPVYEYLRLSAITTDKDGGAISLHIGGWARGDMAEKSSRDRYTDADVQYGYLSYQGAKNNLTVNAGRQFIVEGVAAQRLDGLYVKNDFAAGFSAAAFLGAPTVTTPTYGGDNFVFGGRVSHSMKKYYTIGISALKSFSDSSRYREEEGIDIWLRPTSNVDVTGHSTYNSLTNGWMEHSYAISYSPLSSLQLGIDISNINYKDYLHRVTTSALSLNRGILDPKESVLTIGGTASYAVTKNLTLAGDYKHYTYDIAKGADYFGGKISYTIPALYSAGISIHRMDGNGEKNMKYSEFRIFASKKMGKADLALDFINLYFDDSKGMSNVSHAMTIVAASSYEFTHSLKIGADIEYSKNPDFNNEVKGLLKLTYLFDTKHAAEGRTTSEK